MHETKRHKHGIHIILNPNTYITCARTRLHISWSNVNLRHNSCHHTLIKFWTCFCIVLLLYLLSFVRSCCQHNPFPRLLPTSAGSAFGGSGPRPRKLAPPVPYVDTVPRAMNDRLACRRQHDTNRPHFKLKPLSAQLYFITNKHSQSQRHYHFQVATSQGNL